MDLLILITESETGQTFSKEQLKKTKKGGLIHDVAENFFPLSNIHTSLVY